MQDGRVCYAPSDGGSVLVSGAPYAGELLLALTEGFVRVDCPRVLQPQELRVHGPGVLRVSGSDGTIAEVRVPAEVVELLAELLSTLARGLGVRVMEADAEMISVEAAQKRENDARRAALDELTGLSDELGLYD
jgi:hypothetical protein